MKTKEKIAELIYNSLYFIDANFSTKPIGYSINDFENDNYWRGHAGYFTESYKNANEHKKRVLIKNPFLKIEWDKVKGWSWEKPRILTYSILYLTDKIVLENKRYGFFSIFDEYISKAIIEYKCKGWFNKVRKKITISII